MAKRGPVAKYVVRLSSDERLRLEDMIGTGRDAAYRLLEVVLVFRPVYSLFKVDHGFKSGCHTRWFGFVVIGFARGQDAMGRMGPFSIVVGQPLAYPQPRF